LDDNFLLFSEDEDRPELLLLSNLSKPLDEDRLMSAKLHVWLAKPIFDLDGFLPFPCFDEEERFMSAIRGEEGTFLTVSLFAVDDFRLVSCSDDEDGPRSTNPIIFIRSLLLLSNLPKPLDGLRLCSEDEDRLMSAKLHVSSAKPLFDFDDFLPFPCSDEEERLMSAKRGAEILFLTESLFPVDDFRLVSCSRNENWPRLADPGFLIMPLLLLSNLSKPLDGFLLCSEDEDRLMSAKLHELSAKPLFDLDDFLPFPCSDEEDRLPSAKRGAE
jgi:hypothetical protein